MQYSVLPNQEWFTSAKIYKTGETVELPEAEAAPFIGTVLSEATSDDVFSSRQRTRDQWVKEDADREKERNATLSKWAEEDAKAKIDRLAAADERIVATQRGAVKQKAATTHDEAARLQAEAIAKAQAEKQTILDARAEQERPFGTMTPQPKRSK